MKRTLATAVLMLAVTVTGFAQRGGGGGRPAGVGGGMGGGSMGGSMGGGNMGGNHGDMGTRSGDARGTHGSATGDTTGHGNVGKQSPDTALTKSPKLADNLGKLLPKGMSAQQACSGFKNMGQCVAAIHVSHNLGIPFDDLKSKLTGDNSMKLGKAIQTLKPAADAKAETKKAEQQAHDDLDNNS